MVTYIDMPARDVMLSLTKEIWLLMFLPSLNAWSDNEDVHDINEPIFHDTHILSNLLRRPIRVDNVTKEQCQVRQKNEISASYTWTRQDWTAAITPSFLAIHATLERTLREQADHIDPLVTVALKDFLSEFRRTYIPEKIMQELISAIVKDSKDHLVGGWRTFSDVYQHDKLLK